MVDDRQSCISKSTFPPLALSVRRTSQPALECSCCTWICWAPCWLVGSETRETGYQRSRRDVTRGKRSQDRREHASPEEMLSQPAPATRSQRPGTRGPSPEQSPAYRGPMTIRRVRNSDAEKKATPGPRAQGQSRWWRRYGARYYIVLSTYILSSRAVWYRLGSCVVHYTRPRRAAVVSQDTQHCARPTCLVFLGGLMRPTQSAW